MWTHQRVFGRSMTVSMESGLEDRNNMEECRQIVRRLIVSMESGLEDRNNG